MSTDGNKKQKKAANFMLKEPLESENGNNGDVKESSQFAHSHQKTAHALTHAKMVEKGRKFWEEKEEYDRLSDIEWWKLKAAKDFETGIGQKFYRHGTLSTWTDEQIAALQNDMENTLELAGYGDTQKPTIAYDAKQQLAPNKKVSAGALDDFAAEIKKQQQQQQQPAHVASVNDPKHTQDTTLSTVVIEEDADPLYDFDDEIIHTGDSDEENDDEKRSKYDGSTVIFDPSQLKELTSMDELGRFEDVKEQHSRGHSRTRTAALRVKLQNMQTQLNTVSALSQKQDQEFEQKRTSQVLKDQHIQSQLNAMTGALQSANDELDRAEEQITEKDEEITNLKREVAISKQMNAELTQSTSNQESDTTGDTTGGLTADDLLSQRIRDANRFAFMLSAMQEQLDFERKQFVQKIHNLELQVEHKDTQLNALYQLYNKLVSQTKTTSSSWWERWTK
mmetsp:Transcript_31454/g.50945  ORF Transcript_31454/g.50945 Transcript_31454/m.50945 type:complete len:450 (+) Transcript_31454:56-1405(+)